MPGRVLGSISSSTLPTLPLGVSISSMVARVGATIVDHHIAVIAAGPTRRGLEK